MEVKGTVVKSLGLTNGTAKNGNQWSKGEILIEVKENPQYPKKAVLQNMKNAREFTSLTPGKEYTFKVEFESREYNGKYYTNISCYAWQEASGKGSSRKKAQSSEYANNPGDLASQFPQTPVGGMNSNSDLPL